MYKLPKVEAIGNYRAVYNMAVTDNEFLTGLIKKITTALVAKGHSVVVQTEFINHTKKLASVLGVPFLTGQERDMGVREETIRKLKAKETMCLVSTLFEEGLDIPSLGYTINVVGGLSNISTFQRMRSITAQEGKTTCGIIDFFHQCKYLERHSKVRKKLYKSEPEFEFIMRDASKLTIEEL
jgi:superfamily II DNA or RNA helicase